MEKIPTMFVRDENDRAHVTRDITPGCEWVLAGEGVATRKYDGTCVMFDGAAWWARREIKPGKTAPDGFVALGTDEVTGKTMGWEPAEQSSFYRFLAEAVSCGGDAEIGTYELIGPKINGNPELVDRHMVVPHGRYLYRLAPRDYDGLREFLADRPSIEGVVFHRRDGRMAKIKRRDFPVSAGVGSKEQK